VNLALFTQHFPPHFEGGTESVVRAQARALVALGHRVRVVSGTDRPHEGADVLEEVVDGLPVRFLPRLPDEPYAILLDRPRLRDRIEELSADCDLAHVHHWSTLTGTLVRDLARRMPVVVTLHDYFSVCARFFRLPVAPAERCPDPGDVEPCVLCAVSDAPRYDPDLLREHLRLRAAAWEAELAAASLLVLPSRAHADRLGGLIDLPPDKLHVVPHGLCSPLEPTDVSIPWEGEGTLRVLFLGHMGETKGVTDLVDALADLPEPERGRVELSFFGETVQDGVEDELRERARGVHLRFHGGFEHAELPRRLAAEGGAHLVALPSRAWETYGLVLDEAFALGLPVWVSDRGAPPERVGEAGRALPAEDPPAWTRAFSELFHSPGKLTAERAAVTPRGRTAADAAAELDVLYRSLLEPGGES